MEEDLMDEVYGDLGQDYHGKDTVAAFDEDSVDIYSGLESPSPRIQSNTERNCTLLSPQNLKSLDLYEEIITQEQQDRESSYNELRTRYNAAQKQVEELLRRLQQIETQNTTLNTENSRLKKNICALIKTAKMEVVRKDEEINRLNRSFRPGRSPASRHQSQMNCRRNQVPTRPNTTGYSPSLPLVPTRLNTTGPTPPSQPPEPRQDCLVNDLHKRLHKGRVVDQPPPPPSGIKVFRPPLPDATVFRPPLPDATVFRPPLPDATVLRPPIPVTSKTSRGDSDRDVVQPPLPPPPSDATGFRPPLPVEMVLRPPVPVTSKTSRGDSESPAPDIDSSVSFNKESVNRIPLCELRSSDEHKQTKNSEVRGQNTRLSEQWHKNSPVVNKESHSNERNRSHRAQKDSGKHGSKSSKSRDCSSDVVLDRRSERASNILHCTSSADRTSKGLSKDNPDIQSIGSSRHDKELMHEKEDSRHSRSDKDISIRNRRHVCSNQGSLTERSSKSLNHKGCTSSTRDHQRKEERREGEIGKEKNRSGERSKRKSTSERGKEHEKNRTPEGKPSSMNFTKDKNMDDSKVREQQTQEDSTVLLAKATLTEKNSVEENSPNRKLCFMETLNLTLSPVKKPSKPAEDMEQEDETPPVEVPQDQSDNRGPPDLEDLLVLDEVNSSTDESEECVKEPVVQSSLEIPPPPEPESVESRQTDKESCLNSDKALAETIVATEQLKCHLEVVDSTVQDGSENRPALPEAIVDLRMEPTKQQPLTNDFNSFPDCDYVVKTTLKSRMEDWDSENKNNISEELTDAAVASTMFFKNCVSNSNVDISSNRLTPEHSNGDSVVVTNSCVNVKSNHATPSALVCKSQGFETVTQDPTAAVCVGSPAIQDTPGKKTSEPPQPVIHPEGLQQLPVSVISNSNPENGLTEEVQVVSMDAVSSTRCVESIPEICITSDITTDVTEITVQCEEEKTTMVLNSALRIIGVSKVSSTTGEVAPCEQPTWDVSQTPKKSFHSIPSYSENEEENVEPSSSLLMAHDEDSMMLTLRSLKVIPNPISPLTSPVRPMRKCLQACQNEHTHIKSLSKEFSSAAGDPDSNKVEVNNENKNTGVSVNAATQQDGAGTSDQPSSQEEELEEGEIVSESEGDEKTVTRSSLSKTVRPTSTVQNQLSPKSLPSLSNHLSKDDDVGTQGHSKARTRNLTPPFASPTSNKTRYKIIQPPLPKAPLSTVEEVMDIFAKIRFECRKKYFKFHSVFSKKAFSSLMGMSLDSFTEFVDSICLTKLCSQEDVLKVNLKNMLMVVLNKLADNGIVNRLFDQQPINMKSKLWEFVDVQLDFLFLEIQTALRSVCKSSNANHSTGAEKMDRSLPGNTSPKRPARSPKRPARSPKRPAKSPKRPTKSPRRPARSPKQPARSPKQPARSPRQPARSPRQPARSPRQPARSPKQPAKSVKSPVSTATKLKREQGAVQKTECLTKTIRHKRPQEELSECVEPNMKISRSQTDPPCKTGLGRGKNIRMSSEEEDKDLEPQTSDQSHVQLPLQQRVEILPSNTTSSAEKTAAYVRRLSQNGAFHDKSDFEILTEQQASSLTFNLVTDSQMGEIFKCLLQGSDLLETNISAAESQGWPLGTPRKEGERFLGVTTPSKLVTPSKLIATWSAISPQKFSSPNSKVQVPVNPALLDESCMLEVPSGLLESGIAPESSVFSQRSFSILAEDLAVSLTIPSPLKSENHLSFLHPASGEALSAPDSVISAHFSEDALMDGEDATEQDIHLALDTDNSSGASSAGSKTREPSVNPLFHFKPHLPMRAVVTEKSNDHFIVRIRHADLDSACSGVNCTNLGSNSSSSGDDLTNSGINCTAEPVISTSQAVNTARPGTTSMYLVDNVADPVVEFTSVGIGSTCQVVSAPNNAVINSTTLEINPTSQGVKPLNTGSCIDPGNKYTDLGTNFTWVVDSVSQAVDCTDQSVNSPSGDINSRAAKSPQTPSGEQQHGKPREKHCYEATMSMANQPFHHSCPSTSTETASELSEPCLSIAEDLPERDHSSEKTGKKRTKHHVETKAKRAKKDVIPEKSKHKSPKGKRHRNSKRERKKVSSSPESTPSPNSLSAKNIIKKKGEVVVTWTRDEDRDILLALKMKGASRDTFSALSEKMKKTPAQISERFSQLMKLFKKKEKMAS